MHKITRSRIIAEYRLLGMEKFVDKYHDHPERIIGYVGNTWEEQPEEGKKLDIYAADLDCYRDVSVDESTWMMPVPLVIINDWLARGTKYQEFYIWVS